MIQKKLTKYRNLMTKCLRRTKLYDVHGKAKEKLAVVQEQFYLETMDYDTII